MEELIRQISRHIGYPGNAVIDDAMRQHIEGALTEIERDAAFLYRYLHYVQPADFMLQHSSYMEYLSGAEGYLLCATTLGIQIDRQIKRLQTIDLSYAVIYDAAASVYLEHLADTYEQSLPYPNLGFRFCPGYGGTPLSDNRTISDMIKANRIGISFLDSGLMLPMKSMVGIVRIGGHARKSCKGCIAAESCSYRASGTTCWK